MKTSVLAALALASFTASAQAGDDTWMASASIYGGGTQASGFCTITNMGTVAVAVQAVQVINQNGTTLQLSGPTCIGNLNSFASCSTGAQVATVGGTNTCRVRATNVNSLRGSFQVRDAQGNVLAASDLR